MLLDRKAQVDVQDRDGRSALDWAVRNADNPEHDHMCGILDAHIRRQREPRKTIKEVWKGLKKLAGQGE